MIVRIDFSISDGVGLDLGSNYAKRHKFVFCDLDGISLAPNVAFPSENSYLHLQTPNATHLYPKYAYVPMKRDACFDKHSAIHIQLARLTAMITQHTLMYGLNRSPTLAAFQNIPTTAL